MNDVWNKSNIKKQVFKNSCSLTVFEVWTTKNSFSEHVKQAILRKYPQCFEVPSPCMTIACYNYVELSEIIDFEIEKQSQSYWVTSAPPPSSQPRFRSPKKFLTLLLCVIFTFLFSYRGGGKVEHLGTLQDCSCHRYTAKTQSLSPNGLADIFFRSCFW